MCSHLGLPLLLLSHLGLVAGQCTGCACGYQQGSPWVHDGVDIDLFRAVPATGSAPVAGQVSTVGFTLEYMDYFGTGTWTALRWDQLEVYHGKVGRGLSVEMSVKHGPVTLLSVVQTKGGELQLLVAEGESVPGPVLEIGNTNSRYRFSIGLRKFVDSWSSFGPAHHCAVGVGHIASKIEKLGSLLGMETTRVC